MGLNGQRHALAVLYPGERTSATHCTEGWVGPRAGLGTETTGRILSPLPGIELNSFTWMVIFNIFAQTLNDK
jgi:hypothetical protein